MEIKKVGSVQKLDKDGFIINDFTIENIQPEYNVILDEAINLVQKALGNILHSIYLRGSVLKGQAVKYLSDIDLVIVVNRTLSEEEAINTQEIQNIISDKYSYLNGLELWFKTKENIKRNSKIQFLLKTQSKCLLGKDITKAFPKCKIGNSSYSHAFGLEKSIAKAIELIDKKKTSEGIRFTCTWIMKRLVRVGYELVMKREQAFTRDLYYCYEGFSKHYPQYSEKMKVILYTAINPTSEKEEIQRLISSIDSILIREVKTKLCEN